VESVVERNIVFTVRADDWIKFTNTQGGLRREWEVFESSDFPQKY